MKNIQLTDRVKIFTTIKPHGLKGFFKIFLHVADEDFEALKKFSFYNIDNNSFEIDSVMKIPDGFNIKFKNFNKIEDIQGIIKQDFFIDRKSLDIDFIPQELVGVDVFIVNNGEKEFYGKIVDYKFYKKMNSLMIAIEDKNQEIIMHEMNENFKNFNAKKKEIFLEL